MSIYKLSRRSMELELMDDLSIGDRRLTDALADLRTINKFLGGYSTSLYGIERRVTQIGGRSLHLLDIGCGGGDFAEAFLNWMRARYPSVDARVTCIDSNQATIDWARGKLSESLPADLTSKATVVCCDAFSLPFADKEFDIVHASLFTHHFPADDIVRLLREMRRCASIGVIVNDLHRHNVALQAITFLSRALNACQMVKHDGPLSVRRAFTRDELQRIASAAGIGNVSLTWHWAFRWLLATVS
jgi:ubiquinone/menaquinone biosynthesis C-methylase UbiE